MPTIALIGTSVFIVSYILIVIDKPQKTLAALLGACLMIMLHVVDQHEAFLSIDLNVILLLAGMMVIVDIGSKTGVLEWAAVRLSILAKGEPLRILIYLSLITAAFSSVLDNVTTVILIAPVTFIICQQLQISPVPFLILEAISSTIGGTATLIGDPPNILIGSAAKLSFNAFVFNLAPVVILIFIVYVITLMICFRKEWHVPRDIKARVMEMEPGRLIRDKKLLVKTLVIFFFTLVGFVLHEKMGFEPATVAIAGATLLMIITRSKPDEVFKMIEWPTLFFFGGLFIIVHGFAKIGAIDFLAGKLLSLTEGSLMATSFVILWISGFFSGLLGCVPYVVTIIPMVKEIIPEMSTQLNGVEGSSTQVLWWALSLGACLGGASTLIGASANLIVAGIAERNGYKISFWKYLKYGVPLTLEALIISTAYIYLRYLL